MPKLNIGLIGGCINKQKGISKGDLYHSIIRSKIKTHNPEIDLQFSLGSYESYNELFQKTETLIFKKRPNIIYLFIRPFPLLPLTKPIVKYENEKHNKVRTLHPGLLNRKLEWPDKLSIYQTNTDSLQTSNGKFGFRDLNIILGILLGLNKWANKFIITEIEKIETLCKQENTQLVIVSPPKKLESIMANLICKWTHQKLNQFSIKRSFKYIDIYQLSQNNFEEDNIHFNKKGHQKLGEIIHQNIQLLIH